MPVAISRHFVTVQGRFGVRQVHYRRAGRGPVVLLLHQSPQSSRELEPLLAAWGEEFTAIAPDTPGYGHSDPLPAGEAWSIDDFAEALGEFADTLGLRRFGLYGFHTGASIAIAAAHRDPLRVVAVAANGLAMFDAGERQRILAEYLPPLVPAWDGSHLAWLWGRMREQTIFFPWYDRRQATRMDFDVPPADRLQAGANEFLTAAEHYAVAYRAAFTWAASDALVRMQAPVLVTASARDPLAEHLARIGPHSASVRVEPSGEPTEALAKARAILREYRGDEAPAPPAATPTGRAIWNDYVHAEGRQLRLRRRHATIAAPMRVLVHGVASEAERIDPLLVATEAMVAIDLPGHGLSDAWPGPDPLAAAVRAVHAVTDAHGERGIDLVGVESGALVALAARACLPNGGIVTLIDPPHWTPAEAQTWQQQGLPALTPAWHGGHLLEAWHMLRDGRLFYPWFSRTRAAIRPTEPQLDPGEIQADLRALLRANGAWQALLRRLLTYDPMPDLDRLAVNARITCTPTGAYAASARRLALAQGREIESPAWLPGGRLDAP